MAPETPTRSRLPWPAVAAATVLAAIAALLVVLVLDGDDGGTEPPTTAGTLELRPATGGDPLDVEVEQPGADPVALGELVEGPTVVNFFASWCAPCIAEMPDFESVFQDVRGTVGFVGVAVSDRTADAQRIVEQTGITYPWARDERGDVASAARVTNMPATMFVGADGEVVSVHSGALDADELRDLIREHLGVEA